MDRTLTATFTPEAWIRDYAIEVDPQGPQSWDCTAYAAEPDVARYLTDAAERQGESVDGDGVVDDWDWFKGDPAAPEWVRDWSGPFTIRISAQRD